MIKSTTDNLDTTQKEFSTLTSDEAEKVLRFMRIIKELGAEETWRLCVNE